MDRRETRMGESNLVIDTDVSRPSDLSIVERKGWGHPDTLADHLAEELSRRYSQYTLEEVGAVLHHNFDKLALLGGACEVRYGGGRMIDPVRVLVNGRAARSCGDIAIPVDDIVVEGVRSFFAQRLELLDESSLRIELNITSNPSPGAVLVDGEVPDRTRWFTPRSTEDLRERKTVLANDTSLGTGWSPLNDFEAFVRELSDLLSGPSTFRQENAWCGSDVKVMGYDSGETSEFVVCVPQKSLQVSNRARYLENKALTAYTCEQLAEERLPDRKVTFKVNVRDVPEKDELYLTYTGSSIESGDEGVVGRGNRVNGLITPMRPMNLEGANGKNPVYHVGKLYNLAASRLAALLAELTGDYAEVHLVSASGQRLDRPWRVHVRLCSGVADLGKVQSTILDVLDNFSVLTDELVHAGVELS